MFRNHSKDCALVQILLAHLLSTIKRQIMREIYLRELYASHKQVA